MKMSIAIVCAEMFLILIFSKFALAAVPEKAAPFVNCVKETESHIGTEFPVHDHESALKLCQGASSDAPKTCVETAKKNLRSTDFGVAFSDGDILTLCGGASSDSPVDCAKAAEKYISIAGHPIKSVSDITLLCRHAIDNSAIDCVEQLKSEAKNTVGDPVQGFADVVIACASK